MINLTHQDKLRITLKKGTTLFSLSNCDNIKVFLTSSYVKFPLNYQAIDGMLYCDIPSTIPAKTYGIDISGEKDGLPFSTKYNNVINVTEEPVTGDTENTYTSHNLTLSIGIEEECNSERTLALLRKIESLTNLLDELLDIQSTINTLKQQLAEALNGLLLKDANIVEISNNLEETQSLLVNTLLLLASIVSQINLELTYINIINEKNSELNTAENTLNSLTELVSNLNTLLAQKSQQILDLLNNLSQINLELILERSNRINAVEEKGIAETNLATVTAQKELLQNNYNTLQSNYTTLSSEKDTLQSLCSTLTEQNNQLTTANLQATAQISNLTLEVSLKNAEIVLKNNTISDLEDDLQESQLQLSDMTDERDDAVYVIGSFFGGTVVNLPNRSFNVKLKNITVPAQIESCGNFFQGTKQIESINLGGITRLDDGCFKDCTNLNTVVGVNVIECGTEIFRGCINLETISLPKLATIYNHASNYGYLFYACSTKLKTIDLPALEEAGAYSFAYCSKLKSVSLPKCKTFGNYSFQNCTELEEISLPEVTSAAYSTFQGCSKLKKIEFFKISSLSLGTTTIGSEDLKIILRNTSVVTLPSAGYIANGCTIYVPDDLLSSYKSASNWRNVAEQIKGLSEYVED